jgi:hypothetical protein
MWSATALTPSSSALETNTATQLTPVRRIERSKFKADGHGCAAFFQRPQYTTDPTNAEPPRNDDPSAWRPPATWLRSRHPIRRIIRLLDSPPRNGLDRDISDRVTLLAIAGQFVSDPDVLLGEFDAGECARSRSATRAAASALKERPALVAGFGFSGFWVQATPATRRRYRRRISTAARSPASRQPKKRAGRPGYVGRPRVG